MSRRFKCKRHNKKIDKVNCFTCGKKIILYPCEIRKRNFCDRTCYLKFHKNSIFKCDYCEKEFSRSNFWKKFKHRFCNNICRGEWLSENIRGAKSHFWKGGISRKKYYKFSRQRKEKVRKRDGNRCQFCKVVSVDKKHDVHHIDGNKINYNLENLITLCASCHAKVHTHKFLALMKIKHESA